MNKSQNNKSYIVRNNNLFYYKVQDRPRTTLNRNITSQYRNGSEISSSPQALPKNNLREKEQLYDENLNLKCNINKLRDEHQIARTHNLQMERELIKYEKLLEERVRPIENGLHVQKSSLFFKLKQKQKEQQNELLEKVRELDLFKKSLRTTKFQELEVELEVYKQECMRLRQQLDHTLRTMELLKKSDVEGSSSIEEQYILQEQIIQSLTRNNLILSNKNKDLQTDNHQFKINVETLENELIQKEKEISKAGRYLYDVQKDHHAKMSLKNPPRIHKNLSYETSQLLPSAQKQHLKEITQMERENTASMIDKKQEIDSLTSQLKQKTHQVQQLEKSFYDMTHKDRKEVTIAQQFELYDKVGEKQLALELHIEEIEEQERLSPKLLSSPSVKLSRPSYTNVDQHSKVIQSSFLVGSMTDGLNEDSVQFKNEQSVPRKSVVPKSKKKVAIVNFNDVQNLGNKIRVELQIQQIPYEEIEYKFDYDGYLSILQVKEILLAEPFLIKNDKDCTLIARYLVEDNYDEFVQYDENITNDVEIIKSIFKKLIGKYELFCDEEKHTIHQYLTQTFNKYGTSMIDAINSFVVKKKNLQPGVCEMCDLESAFKFCDVQISQRQTEYLKILIFKMSSDLNFVPYLKLRQEFLDNS